MKRLLLFCFSTLALHATGTVQVSADQLGTSGTWVVAYRWTADASDGSVPVTSSASAMRNCCAGYYYTQVETVPGATAPTNNYSVAIKDSSGMDILGGAAVSVSSTTAQVWAPTGAATPIQGAFTLNVTGNSVNSATGIVYVFLTKPGTINPALLATLSLRGYPYPGAVNMIRDINRRWSVLKPDGTLLNISGSTCQGLPEALAYGWNNAYPVVVYGGGITNPTTGVVPSTANSTITCTSTLAFPTGWNNSFEAFNVNLNCFVGNSDCITYDSMDLTLIDWHDSQILYPGTGTIHRFNPVTNNGESFVGVTETTFRGGHAILVVSTTNLNPDATKGTGVRFTMTQATTACSGASCSNGNGLINANPEFTVSEIASGLIGIQVDNPGTGNQFSSNWINGLSIHNTGTLCIKVGSATPTASSIFGNHYAGILSPGASGEGVITYGGTSFGGLTQTGGDKYNISVVSGVHAWSVAGAGDENLVIMATASTSGALYVNSSSGGRNRIIDTLPTVCASIAAPGTGVSFRNTYMKPALFAIAGGTVTEIDISVDNSTWVPISYAANASPTVNPGMYLKAAYSLAPSFNVCY